MSGLLTARKAGHGIELIFPLMNTLPHQISEEILSAYNIESKIVSISTCELASIIELENIEAVRKVVRSLGKWRV